MTYQKRRSTILEKAQARLRGLQSTRSAVNLGNGLTLQDYAASIETSITRLEAHNLVLAEADRTRIELAEAETSVSALSSRVLSAIAAMYGRDSKEYEMAGGRPLSSYRRSKKPSSAASEPQSETFSGTAQPSDTAQSNGSATNGTGAMARQ